jgi:Flp pilus assembly protein TadD
MAALAAGAYLAVAQGDAARVDTANGLGEAGRFAQAAEEARRVDRGAAGARAIVAEAYALRGLGRLAEAERAMGRAVARFPNDWVLRRDRALLLAQLGRDRRAAEEMGRALHLNPRMRLPDGFRRLP